MNTWYWYNNNFNCYSYVFFAKGLRTDSYMDRFSKGQKLYNSIQRYLNYTKLTFIYLNLITVCNISFVLSSDFALKSNKQKDVPLKLMYFFQEGNRQHIPHTLLISKRLAANKRAAFIDCPYIKHINLGQKNGWVLPACPTSQAERFQRHAGFHWVHKLRCLWDIVTWACVYFSIFPTKLIEMY